MSVSRRDQNLGEVVALSSARDTGTGWSCQTKPVKCKTNLPIHLSESGRGRRRWCNCARCYMYRNNLFHFFFAPKSHGYGGQISQPILPALCLSLSCFRLHRRADNWMKNSSCVGRCCVCLCAYVGFKAWLHFMSDELFVCLRSSVDA